MTVTVLTETKATTVTKIYASGGDHTHSTTLAA